MASLLPGYNYDIFISYRQKDNNHDGSVTEFVDQLNSEIFIGVISRTCCDPESFTPDYELKSFVEINSA
jgi:hypothetical protein